MTQRRAFFRRLSAGFAAVSLPAGLLRAVVPPDEAWLNGLIGKHKQFFDVNAINGGAPLNRVANFLSAYHEAYGLSDSEVNAIFGAHGSGLPIVLDSPLWDRFRLGARYSVTDPNTGAPAKRNPFATSSGAGDNTVESLRKRGVRFLACRQTIARLSKELSKETRTPESEVRLALEHGLVAGVTLVPAMVVAANRAQEQGVAYLFVG